MQQEVEFLRFISSFKYLHWYNNKNLTIIITFVSLCCCIPAWSSWYRIWWTWGVSTSWWEDQSSCRTSILISQFFYLPPPSWWVGYWNLVHHTKLFTSHSETDKPECCSPFSALQIYFDKSLILLCRILDPHYIVNLFWQWNAWS